jgi:hypothetical protein
VGSKPHSPLWHHRKKKQAMVGKGASKATARHSGDGGVQCARGVEEEEVVNGA